MSRSRCRNEPGRRSIRQGNLARWLGLILLGVRFGAGSAYANSTDILTHHYDNFRTGWNANETELTPSKVRSGSFGVLFPPILLDEQVDAQPLIVTNILTGASRRDLAFIATENNTIYAIDTSSGAIVQKRSLGPPVSTGVGKSIVCGNNGPLIGVTGTPVIDRATDSLYVISFTEESGEPVYRIHSLDLATLSDKVPSRVISASAKLNDNSIYNFNAKYSRQRSALTFSNGNIYAAFGSFCDGDWAKTRGWVLGWQGNNLDPIGIDEITDRRAHTMNDYFLASIWMSGSGAAVDQNGDLFVVTGNSDRTRVNLCRGSRD